MDFSEAIGALAERVQKLRNNLTTEEATKTALVLPFIKELGYDIFDPFEVIPEFTADVASLKGEKVDYAIMKDGKPIMIIECKCCGASLDDIKREQLHRYFLTVDSSIGILTDGIRYLFFSTSEDGKNMDATPFMEFNLDNIDPTLIPELRKLCKGKFDIKKTLDTVSELKFNRQFKRLLNKNLQDPQESLVGYFMREAGVRVTQKATELYSGYVKRAFNEFIAEQVDGRLKTALEATIKKEEPPVSIEVASAPETTEFEWHAFYLVKSILMGHIDPERVSLRNLAGVGRSAIILDDSIRRPVIRFDFVNLTKLTIELGGSKERVTHQIMKLDDILSHSDAIRAAACVYDEKQ